MESMEAKKQFMLSGSVLEEYEKLVAENGAYGEVLVPLSLEEGYKAACASLEMMVWRPEAIELQDRRQADERCGAGSVGNPANPGLDVGKSVVLGSDVGKYVFTLSFPYCNWDGAFSSLNSKKIVAEVQRQQQNHIKFKTFLKSFVEHDY
jgi:hypothetical protein